MAKDLVEENPGRELRAFPADLKRAARKKLAMLHAAKELRDLLSPPENRPERLKGERRNEYSLRINDQWRVVFRFAGGNAEEVRVEDCHR